MSGEAASYRGSRPNPDEAAHYAAANSNTEDKSLFSSVLSSLMGRDDDQDKEADEDEVKHAADAHDRVYNQSGDASSRDLGAAAALQAFKLFSSKKESSGNNNGGGSTELVGMAMGEAMKLFNKNNGKQGNINQADMLQNAAKTAMKLFITYQNSQKPPQQSNQQSGGSSSGGALGALLSALGSSGGNSNNNNSNSSSSTSSKIASQLLSKFL